MDHDLQLFRYISRVQYRYITCLLHYLFLSTCLISKTIPLGLQLKNTLSPIHCTPELKTIWQESLFTTSLHLLFTLTQHYRLQQERMVQIIKQQLSIFGLPTSTKKQQLWNVLHLQAVTSFNISSCKKLNKLFDLRILITPQNHKIIELFRDFTKSELYHIYDEVDYRKQSGNTNHYINAQYDYYTNILRSFNTNDQQATITTHFYKPNASKHPRHTKRNRRFIKNFIIYL